MASSRDAFPTKGKKPKVLPSTPPSSIVPPRVPLPKEDVDPELNALLLPLLNPVESEQQHLHHLDQARIRLLDHSIPEDAVSIISLLNEDALDLGTLPMPSRASIPRTQEQRQEIACIEQDRAHRLEYLSLLFSAACLHPSSQKHLASILAAPHPALLKERLVLQLIATPATLQAPLKKALTAVLDLVSPTPSTEERNLLSSVAKALFVHLSSAQGLATLQPYLEEETLASPGGEVRAQMILADLEATRLTPAWRPILGRLLAYPALVPFVCDLFSNLPPAQEDAAYSAAVLDKQLDRGEPPDGYLIWLLARAPHFEATKTLLRLLDAEQDPDWQTILEGIDRVGDPAVVPALLAWIDHHKKRTGHQASWDGFEAARSLIRRLSAPRLTAQVCLLNLWIPRQLTRNPSLDHFTSPQHIGSLA